MKTKFINYFGGPGIGKSTAAAGKFVELKKQGKSVELVTEFAKELVWEGRSQTLTIQPYVTSKQYRNLKRLEGQVEYVVTDAPVILGAIYPVVYNLSMPSSWVDFVIWMHNDLSPSTNILLSRQHSYEEKGRIQSKEEASNVDRMIKELLDDYNISYEELK